MLIAGTYFVQEGDRCTVRLPKLREGNDQGRVLLFEHNGEIHIPAYIEEAKSDDLLLLNQYDGLALIERIDVLDDVKDDFDPSRGKWIVERGSRGLDVEYVPPEMDGTDASEAM